MRNVLFAAFTFFALFSAASEAAESVTSNEAVQASAPSDDQCNDILSSLQYHMLHRLDGAIYDIDKKKRCLGSNSAYYDGCPAIQKATLAELGQLEQHRQNQASVEMQFKNGSGFELRANSLNLGTDSQGSLTIVSGSLTNGMGQRMQGLSKQEEQALWAQHNSNLSEYLAKEWWPQQADKFPGWRQCLQTENERIVLDPNRMEYQTVIERPADRHLLFPRFVPQYKCTSISDQVCRTNNQTCLKLIEFWSSAPYGADYDRSRMRKSAMKDRDLKEGLPAWLYDVAGPVSADNREQNLKTAYAAYDKLDFQTKKLREWIKNLKDYQLQNLLEFTNPSESKYASQCTGFKRRGLTSIFCEDHGHSMIGLRVVDECLAGFFMPANAALSLFKDVTNDQAFLAGLQNKGAWQEKHDENVRSQMINTMYAVPVTAASAAVGGVAAKGVQKVAGKVIDATLRLMPYKKLVSDSLFKNAEFRSLVIYLENKGVPKDQIERALRDARYGCR